MPPDMLAKRVAPEVPAEVPAVQQPIDVGALLQTVIDRGATADSVGVVRELVNLKRELDADNAKRTFARAFAALQRDVRPIKANRIIPDASGRARSKFADFLEIMSEVGPLLIKHGFSISFGQRIEGQHIIATCTLTHEDGHERTNEFSVRNGKGPPSCSDAQVDGGNSTFAKRYALCLMLNIVTGDEGDARLDGDQITPDEAAALERRVMASGGNLARILKLGGVSKVSDMRRAKYRVVLDHLERQAGATTTDPADVGGSPAPDESQAQPDLTWAEFKPLADAKAMSLGWSPSELDTALAKAAKAKGERSHLAASAEFYAGFLGAMGSERMDKLRK